MTNKLDMSMQHSDLTNAFIFEPNKCFHFSSKCTKINSTRPPDLLAGLVSGGRGKIGLCTRRGKVQRKGR